MSVLTKKYGELLKAYARPIVHMRRQLHLGRFGLVLGAGLSKTFDLPDWPELVNRIAADSDVKAKSFLRRFTTKASLSYKTELLYQHFRKLEADKCTSEKLHSLEFENRTLAKWLRICAKHLYKDSRNNVLHMLKKHPYLSHLIPIIQDTPLTVTYNFDDILECALSKKKRSDDKSRGFEQVTNPWMQFRRPKCVVYHPNGVIPSTLMELPHDRFIFSESSFAKQKVGASQSDNSFLVNHFCKNTCLIIGSSLEDETLRNVLVQSAEINPGNCHYYVQFLADGKKMYADDVDAIRRANFNVFNLITLFLDQSEIAVLAQLINSESVEDNDLFDLATRNNIPLTYRFYITGALGVGKSTTATRLRNLMVIDEWLEPRPEILAKPWNMLTAAEEKKADSWVARQFVLKNDRLRYEKYGIFVIDRPPLDPLAFTPAAEYSSKASKLLKNISANNKGRLLTGQSSS
jgi:hypothetical protein